MEVWSKDSVDVQPWQAIPTRLTELGLTAVDGLTQVWFVSARGELFGGAEAINQVLRHVWWLRPFTCLYYLPGFRQLQNRLYRWVANNRYRLPGSDGQCRLPEEKT